MKKRNLKKERGITLIALVVTIVVLLILAGISINAVLGDNGLISKAKDAKEKTEQDQLNTEKAINSLVDEMDAILGNGGSGNTGNGDGDGDGDSKVGTKFTSTGTIDGGQASEKNPTIPEGYTPINTEDAKWDPEDGPEYNKGLVITDDSGNEWVWVPVKDATVMYERAETPIELTGGEGNTYLSGVTVEKYTKSEIISGKTRGLPNSTSYREVDVVVGYDGASYDAVESNRLTAGFTKSDGTTMTLAEMAQTMVNEYETMIASIGKYKGFYIGRYELTANGVKAGVTLTNESWYTLYANCKNLSSSEDAMTRMIWGAQWDVTCNWLDESGYSITDSSSWGNYSNSTVLANDGTTELKASGTSTKLETGITTYTMANNIYDFAGNCTEWSQEACDDVGRVDRSGEYSADGSDRTASYRGFPIEDHGLPTNTPFYCTTRPTLIVQP